MRLQDLPKLGAIIDGGIFAGVITAPKGTHCAVVRLPGVGSNMNWDEAKEWAAEQGGELPSCAVSALLFANVKDQLHLDWHWTSDEIGAYAWYCDFGDGGSQDVIRKNYEGSAVAVRLIELEE